MSVFFEKGRQRMQRTNFYKAIGFVFIMMASLSVGCAEDQEKPDLPKLPQRSENLTDVVPLFWAIECISQGDFNKDGQSDTVMVVKKVTNQSSFWLRIVKFEGPLKSIQQC